MKSARIWYPKICLFDIKKYFELNAIKKQQMQEILFLPSPFLPKAGYKFTFSWRQTPVSPRDGTKEFANKPYSINFLPYLYLLRDGHPWKPAFPCPVVSLQIYCSLLKMLYKMDL